MNLITDRDLSEVNGSIKKRRVFLPLSTIYVKQWTKKDEKMEGYNSHTKVHVYVQM